MKIYWIVALLSATATLSACNYAGSIPVIGFDENGNPAQVSISGQEYSKRLGAVLTSMADERVSRI